MKNSWTLRLGIIFFALFLILILGCKTREESDEEETPATTTDTTTSTEPMGTDTGMGMGTGAEEQQDPNAIIASKEEVIANFPKYNAAAAAGKVKTVTVFYATDRNDAKSKDPNTLFGTERSPRGELHWGTCVVSIPKTHKLAGLEGPGGLTKEENPLQHIVLLRVSKLSKDLFISNLHASVDQASSKELLVFVHGFNVEFKDAARRTAQLAVDLEFKGVPVFYSWPSQGDLTRAKYEIDRQNAIVTIPRLEKFLTDLADRSGATAIHLIAHSMGADALTKALGRIALRRPNKLPIFTDVVLAAPDIDRDDFLQLADEFKTAGQRVTLYSSSGDRALQLAHKINGFNRAGDSGAGIVVVPGIETIDVSAVDTSLIGHFYYGSNAPILVDMASLINEGKTASHRFRLDQHQKDGIAYWQVKS